MKKSSVKSREKPESSDAQKMGKGRKKIKVSYEESEPSKLETEKSETKEELKLSNKLVKDQKESVPAADAKAKKTKDEKYNPKNWKELINGMREMRKTHPAPVDTMGANSCHDESAPEKTQRFQKLVALLLSSQTKDEVTHAACKRLQAFGFTPEHLVESDVKDIEDVLRPVGFYKTKAKHLQQTSQILIDEYDSDIPNTLEGLMKLPGIGAKMAHICMRTAWNQITGIGVDTHVHRISNRWNFVKKETKNPEQTRKDLEDWLPRELWDEITLLMVGFGQTICAPTKPKCEICVNNKICPSAFKESSPKKKRTN